MNGRPNPTPGPEKIADALVITACAYVSLLILDRFGMLDRERTLYGRWFPHFRRVVLLTYGHLPEHDLAASLATPQVPVTCVCNDLGPDGSLIDPALFLATAPDRIAADLAEHGCRSTLVYTDQFWGGDAAINIVRLLRERGVRSGLLARGGYHWSWTMARSFGPASFKATNAAYLEGELLRAADVIAATTRRIIEDCAWRYEIPYSRFRLVPNFVLTETPVPPFASRDRGLILTAGRLAPEKRIHLLFEAFARLPEKVRAASRILVVGEGPCEEELRALAARLKIDCDFMPRVPHRDLLALMGRCRVYAQCSLYEGHPKTILEAMGMGAPVLVTDSPGITDHLCPGRDAVASAADPAALSGSLRQLLTDDAMAAGLGEAASKRIRGESDPGCEMSDVGTEAGRGDAPYLTAPKSLSLDCIFPRLISACREAMTIAGADRVLPAATVRWDQPLLETAPEAAAGVFASSIDAFTRRLDPEARAAFTGALMARFGADTLISPP